MWLNITKEDLKIVLASDELDKIENISTDINTIIDSTIKVVCEFVRGAISSKGFTLATLENSIPNSYELPTLIVIRQKLWSRFPNSMEIALDEVRREEEKWALKVIQDVMIDVSPIQPEYDPENPDNPEYKPKPLQGSIKVPALRFPQWPHSASEWNVEINKKD